MGISYAPDIFQEKMHSLIEGLEFIQCYLDDLLILSNGSFNNHLDKIDEAIMHLSEAGLKVRAKKYNFVMTELECLRCYVT